MERKIDYKQICFELYDWLDKESQRSMREAERLRNEPYCEEIAEGYYNKAVAMFDTMSHIRKSEMDSLYGHWFNKHDYVKGRRLTFLEIPDEQ